MNEEELIKVKLADVAVEVNRDTLLKIPYFESLISRWDGVKDGVLSASKVTLKMLAHALDEVSEKDLEVDDDLVYLGLKLPAIEESKPEPIIHRQNQAGRSVVFVSTYKEHIGAYRGDTQINVRSITKPMLYLTSGQFVSLKVSYDNVLLWYTTAELNKLLLEQHGVEPMPDNRYTQIFLPRGLEDISALDRYANFCVTITTKDVITHDCCFMWRDRVNSDELIKNIRDSDLFKRRPSVVQTTPKISYAKFEQYIERNLVKGKCDFPISRFSNGIVIISDNEIQDITIDTLYQAPIDGFSARNYTWLARDMCIPKNTNAYLIPLEWMISPGGTSVHIAIKMANPTDTAPTVLYEVVGNMFLYDEGSVQIRYIH